MTLHNNGIIKVMSVNISSEKGTIKTELTGIEGIGNTTADKLLRVFKSVKKVKEASLAELEAAIDKSKGKIVYQHFHPETE